MFSTRASMKLSLALHALHVCAQSYPTCEAYGVDFQNGGTYFQNASSTDDFTFVSIFEHCQNDVAYNILVDPNGDEYFCDNVPLQPDDTNQVSSCPIQKCEMYTGPWSIIIASNNGDDGAEPIAYERDFNLVVATPVTSTTTPTVTISSTSTPITSLITSTTITDTVTLTSTITRPAWNRKPTITIVPSAVTTTKIWTLGTITKTSYVLTPTVVTKTLSQTCSTSTQPQRDPYLTWVPYLLPEQVTASITPLIESQASAAPAIAALLATIVGRQDSVSPAEITPPSKRRDTAAWRQVSGDRAARLALRKKRLAHKAALEPRGVDQSSTVVTETNTALWSTSTSTITAPTSTLELTTVVTKTTTVTIVNTLWQGPSTLSVVTITRPTPTRTSLALTIITQIVATVTRGPTYTVYQHAAPASLTAICTINGGRMRG